MVDADTPASRRGSHHRRVLGLLLAAVLIIGNGAFAFVTLHGLRLTEVSRIQIALAIVALQTLLGLALIGVTFSLLRRDTHDLETLARTRTSELAERDGELVNERKSAEAALHDREARLQLALEMAGLGVWEYDIVRGLERLDARAAAVTGGALPADVWLASDGAEVAAWQQRIHPDDRPARHSGRRALLETADDMLSGEYRARRADGGWTWISVLSTAVERDPTSGQALRVVSVAQDITRRKQTELELRHAQRMEAIGQLTGGLAHDFNNLLGVIIGNVEFLADAVQANPEHAELASDILNSALHGAELTRRLLAFARRLPLQPRLIDLNEHLAGQAAMLQRMLGEGIQVSLILAPGLWLTRADPAQVTDALLNLALNARDAMPLGGRLTVETANAELDADYAARNEEVMQGEYVVLCVSDTGTGMPPDILARAIEPFFTTKGVGEGSGLGLSMIYGFAKQSGGHLRLYSEVGSGTTVRLYLPRAQGVPAAARADGLDRQLPGGSETILLVDDNAEMRGTAIRHLSGLGYCVRSVETGAAALALLRGGEAFDLLFTDIAMPGGLSGHQLAIAAQSLRPGLPVLFSSGFATPVRRDGDVGQIIEKPYRRLQLAEMVRGVLDAAALQRRARVI
jgi:signal transduction histidine kinase